MLGVGSYHCVRCGKAVSVRSFNVDEILPGQSCECGGDLSTTAPEACPKCGSTDHERDMTGFFD